MYRARMMLLGVLLLAAGCSTAADDPLVVDEIRVRALIPGQDRTAGYFTLENRGDTEIVLTGAEGAGAASIEMHTMEHADGMMRMRRLTEVVVPAGDTVHFEPGGRHLMLLGVTELDEQAELVLQARAGDGSTIRHGARIRIIPIGGN